MKRVLLITLGLTTLSIAAMAQAQQAQVVPTEVKVLTKNGDLVDILKVNKKNQPWLRMSTTEGAIASDNEIYKVGKVGIGDFATISATEIAQLATLSVKGSYAGLYSTKSASATLANEQFVAWDGTATGTLTLPSTTDSETGRVYTIINRSKVDVTLSGAGAEEIKRTKTISLRPGYVITVVRRDNAQWDVVNWSSATDPDGSFVTLDTEQTITGKKTFTADNVFTGSNTLGSGKNTTSIVGDLNIAQNTAITGNLAVTGTTTLGGATTVNNTLNTTGATTLGSTLDVTGATTLGSTLDVTGASNIAGATSLGNTLNVAGNTSLGTVDALVKLIVNGSTGTIGQMLVTNANGEPKWQDATAGIGKDLTVGDELSVTLGTTGAAGTVAEKSVLKDISIKIKASANDNVREDQVLSTNKDGKVVWAKNINSGKMSVLDATANAANATFDITATGMLARPSLIEVYRNGVQLKDNVVDVTTAGIVKITTQGFKDDSGLVINTVSAGDEFELKWIN